MEKRMAKGSLANAKLWLEKLRRNEDAISVEVLRTQYSKGYATLLRRTKEAVEEVVTEHICSVASKMDSVDEALNFLQKEREKGLYAKAWNAAYETKNYLSALSVAQPARLRFQREVYQPYWLKHVHILNDGRYYNDLHGVYWKCTQNGDNGDGCWINDHFCMLGLPPTKELCEKQFERDYELAVEEANAAA